QHPSVGPVFNKEFWGGYLIEELAPRQKVFIDGRADLYEAAGVLTDYLSIMRLAPNTPFLLRKYQVRSCLIEPDSPLATLLAQSPDWRRAYSDGISVIFVRKTEAAAGVLLPAEHRVFITFGVDLKPTGGLPRLLLVTLPGVLCLHQLS
ncbi:MAG TPA: hypothetical protein VNG91_05685, partial [Terriglobia bacterium]|nr:hypothetical protein [Terriglobia bacterium]